MLPILGGHSDADNRQSRHRVKRIKLHPILNPRLLSFERCLYVVDPGCHCLVINDERASDGGSVCRDGRQRSACKECRSGSTCENHAAAVQELFWHSEAPAVAKKGEEKAVPLSSYNIYTYAHIIAMYLP